jgi:hypothetical protein
MRLSRNAEVLTFRMVTNFHAGVRFSVVRYPMHATERIILVVITTIQTIQPQEAAI